MQPVLSPVLKWGKLLSFPFHLLDLCLNGQIHDFANKPEAYCKGESQSKMQSTGWNIYQCVTWNLTSNSRMGSISESVKGWMIVYIKEMKHDLPVHSVMHFTGLWQHGVFKTLSAANVFC